MSLSRTAANGPWHSDCLDIGAMQDYEPRDECLQRTHTGQTKASQDIVSPAVTSSVQAPCANLLAQTYHEKS